MKFTVDVSEALNAEIRAAATAAGITRAEWVRAALAAAAHPDPIQPHPAAGVGPDAPDMAADLAEALARVAYLEGRLEERDARVSDAHATIARLTPDADRMPPPLMVTGPGWVERTRKAWAHWWAGRR
jgi:phage shock protein A